jgi:hypothetical protein
MTFRAVGTATPPRATAVIAIAARLVVGVGERLAGGVLKSRSA